MDFMKILSVPQDHCWSHNNFMTISLKNYTLYGVFMVITFRFQSNKFVGKSSKIRSLWLKYINFRKLSKIFGNLTEITSLCTVKNVCEVLRVIWPHFQRFCRSGLTGTFPYSVRTSESQNRSSNLTKRVICLNSLISTT